MTTPQNDVESLVQKIDQELDRLDVVSRQGLAESEFFPQVTKSVASVLSAESVSIAQSTPDARFVSVGAFQASNSSPLALKGELQSGLRKLVGSAGSPSVKIDVRDSSCEIIAARISVGGNGWGALLVALSGEVDPLMARGCREFLVAVCEIIEDYLVRVVPRESDESDRLLSLAKNVHSSLKLEKVGHQIASETRDVVDADRVCVCKFRGRRSRVMAVGGLDSQQSKSPTLVYLQQLIDRVVATGTSFWYDGVIDDVDEALRPVLAEYLAESPKTRSIAVIPLVKITDSVYRFALVVEFLRQCDVPQVVRRINRLVPHAEAALSNSAQYESIPFRFLAPLVPSNWTARFGLKVVLSGFLLLALVGLIIAGMVIPADLEIPVRGEIRPANEKRIFASHDGVIQKVSVQHGQRVEADTLLVTLRAPDLDLELQRVSGELETTQQKQEALQFAINQQTGTGEAALRSQNQMAAEIKELELRGKNLVKIYSMLEAQRDDLEIKSPIAGSVVTWEVRDLLQLRPVRNGDVLMTVADLDGPWRLDLQVADGDIGHVLRTQRESQKPLQLDYCVSSDPEQKYTATVASIALETQGSVGELPYVDIVGEFEGDHPRSHSGNTVVGRIHCGQRPLLWVWFREIIEAVQRRFYW